MDVLDRLRVELNRLPGGAGAGKRLDAAAALAAVCAMLTGEVLPASGIGRSGTTSLTAGLPARYLASPGETVAERALISEKLFMLTAWVSVS